MRGRGGHEGAWDASASNQIDADHIFGTVVQAGIIESLVIADYGLSPLRVPRELPPAPHGFVDRDEQRARLTSMARRGRAVGEPGIAVLAGSPGAGKSAVAIRWAHDNAQLFPDGQLHISLADDRAAGGSTTEEVLSRVLSRFGVPASSLPSSLEDRRSLYHSLTADKEMLVCIEDVTEASQVRAMLPSSARSLVIVTTATPLPELELDGAERFDVPPLDSTSARLLLGRYLGVERVETDIEEVDALLDLCGGHPLAIRMCASVLVAEPGLRIGDLLQDIERHLAGEDAGDNSAAVFVGAYRALPPALQNAYLRLAAHPTPGMDFDAARVLLMTTREEGNRLISALERHHMLEREGTRLRFHFLLWKSARRLRAEVCDREERAAQDRLIVDHYTALAQCIDHGLIRKRLRLAPDQREEAQVFPRREVAFARFETDRAAMLAAQELAVRSGDPVQAWYIAEALWPAFDEVKDLGSARVAFGVGAEAARAASDPVAEARMRAQLAHVLMDSGDLDRAEKQFIEARRLAEGTEDLAVQASVLEWMGKLRFAQRRYRGALRLYLAARAINDEIGSSKGVLIQDYLVGKTLLVQDQAARAADCLGRASQAVDREGDAILACRILLCEGDALLKLARAADAIGSWQEVAALARRNGLPRYEAASLGRISEIEGSPRDGLANGELRERIGVLRRLYAVPALDRELTPV